MFGMQAETIETPLTCGGTCSLARISFHGRIGEGGGAGSSASGNAAMLAAQIGRVTAVLGPALLSQGPCPGY